MMKFRGWCIMVGAVGVTVLMATLLLRYKCLNERVDAAAHQHEELSHDIEWAHLTRARARAEEGHATLKGYGFKPCSWMKQPATERYPRVHSSPLSHRSSIYKCMAKLAAYQERGDFVFVPFGGVGLTAMTMGGHHGHWRHGTGDDSDFDLKSWSRIHDGLQKHCEGVNLGAYGFEYWPKPENLTVEQSIASISAMHSTNKSSAAYKAVPRTLQDMTSACVCEWEDLSLLCLHDDTYWVYDYGRSYWVPPAGSGFKATGDNFKLYMSPGSDLEPHFDWLVNTMKSLSTVDTNNDGEINATEFLRYVVVSPNVNQRWLNRTRVQRPCVIYNAAVHYNHTYSHGRVAMRLRKAASDTLTDENWKTYDSIWQNIVYMRDGTDGEQKCRGYFSDA